MFDHKIVFLWIIIVFYEFKVNIKQLILHTFFFLELSKYLERKEELELIKIKKQQKESIQSFGALKNQVGLNERKKNLELPENGILIIVY